MSKFKVISNNDPDIIKGIDSRPLVSNPNPSTSNPPAQTGSQQNTSGGGQNEGSGQNNPPPQK